MVIVDARVIKFKSKANQTNHLDITIGRTRNNKIWE